MPCPLTIYSYREVTFNLLKEQQYFQRTQSTQLDRIKYLSEQISRDNSPEQLRLDMARLLQVVGLLSSSKPKAMWEQDTAWDATILPL